MRNENKTLRDQIQRALKELKAFQIKYPSPFTSKDEPVDTENFPPWTAAPDIMQPLFEAYDTRKKISVALKVLNV